MQDRFKLRVKIKADGKVKIFDVVKLDIKLGQIFFKRKDGQYYNIGTDCKDVELIQCTGLKDKNGHLIYEGDIMQVEFKNETHIAVVEYDKEDTGFGCKFNPKSDILYSLSPMESRGLIMGNIYKNPELLKKFNNINQRNSF